MHPDRIHQCILMVWAMLALCLSMFSRFTERSSYEFGSVATAKEKVVGKKSKIVYKNINHFFENVPNSKTILCLQMTRVRKSRKTSRPVFPPVLIL